jgi:hypothetical protein
MEEGNMLQRMFMAAPSVALVIGLVAGCAGSRLSASGLGAAAVAPAGDLSGTWHGTFGVIGGALAFYEDEGESVLRINPDGTFTATITPNGGTNNLAKRSTLSGTVVTNGDRVTLRNTQGPWPSIGLKRSGDNTLYGVPTDPAIEGPVLIKFQRESTRG